MNQATAEYIASYRPPRAGTAFRVALEQLAARMDASGRVRLTHAQLGRAIARCEREVQNIVHRLEREGWLAIEAHAGHANVYRVLVAWVRRVLEGEHPDEGSLGMSVDHGLITAEALPPNEAAPPSWRPPPRIYSNGGCVHSLPACEACGG